MNRSIFFYLIACFGLAFSGCGNSENTESFIGLNNFKLDSTLLKDGEPLKIIYCSSGNDPNIEKKYLIQFICIKMNTHDTVNVLAFSSDHIKQEDTYKTFHFRFLQKDINDKLAISNAVAEKLSHTDSINLANIHLQDLLMVAQDPKYKQISENKYPAIIGEIF